MMMIRTFTTFVLAVCAFTVVLSAPLDLRDVYVPPVIEPVAGSILKAGSQYNVTWDVSNPPAQITNKKGKIVLAKGAYLVGLNKPLAQNFDILLGWQEVTIPADAEPGDDYSVVLFGDSGNNGPRFSIVN